MLKNRCIKFLGLMLLPMSLFAFEVEFNKKFTKELMADTLSTQLIIRIDSKVEKDISKRLTKFNEEIKDNDEVEKKLGNFTIRPSYKYNSTNSPKIIGYIGELRYTINSTDAKTINKFISDINNLKESRDTSITVSGLSWKVKDSTYNIALDILRLEAIYWGQTYASNLSKDLNKRCMIQNIKINSHSNIRPMRTNYALERMSSSKQSIPVPEIDRQKISINPMYVLECK